MPSQTDDPARAARLAAKLRENLHRRKAQARALGADRDQAGDGDSRDPAGENPPPALSKPAPES